MHFQSSNLLDISVNTAKKYRPNFSVKSLLGAANQSRTGDLILTKDALYLLSHSSKY